MSDYNLEEIISEMNEITNMYSVNNRHVIEHKTGGDNTSENNTQAVAKKGNTAKNKYTKGTQGNKKYYPIDTNNYSEIPRLQWNSIPTNTYIRWADKDGNGRNGGKIYGISTENGESLLMLSKYNTAMGRNFHWKVKMGEISKIYKYIGQDNRQKNTVGGNNQTGNNQTNNRTNQNNSTANDNIDHNENKSINNTSNDGDDFMSQLGGKLLFDEGDLLKREIETLKNDVKRIDENMITMFAMIKKIYKKLGMITKQS